MTFRHLIRNRISIRAGKKNPFLSNRNKSAIVYLNRKKSRLEIHRGRETEIYRVNSYVRYYAVWIHDCRVHLPLRVPHSIPGVRFAKFRAILYRQLKQWRTKRADFQNSVSRRDCYSSAAFDTSVLRSISLYQGINAINRESIFRLFTCASSINNRL